MSAEAAAYPKLFKIYKELNRQNEIIFETEKERNEWELEHDNLKGLARFTKKGELQSKIDRKNEEIDILKIGLSGISKRYGYLNVQEFYQIYHKTYSAYVDYTEQLANWRKIYGIAQNYKKKVYVNTCEIYKKNALINNRNKFSKVGAEGQDRLLCLIENLCGYIIYSTTSRRFCVIRLLTSK